VGGPTAPLERLGNGANPGAHRLTRTPWGRIRWPIVGFFSCPLVPTSAGPHRHDLWRRWRARLTRWTAQAARSSPSPVVGWGDPRPSQAARCPSVRSGIRTGAPTTRVVSTGCTRGARVSAGGACTGPVPTQRVHTSGLMRAPAGVGRGATRTTSPPSQGLRTEARGQGQGFAAGSPPPRTFLTSPGSQQPCLHTRKVCAVKECHHIPHLLSWNRSREDSASR
jgi:hypothetical protein